MSTILLRGAAAALLVWLLVQWEHGPLVRLLFLAAAGYDLLSIPFALAALRQRIKEIESGEEDEARKY